MAKAEIKARATLDNKQFKAGVAQMGQGVERFKNNQLRNLAGQIGAAFAVGAIFRFTKAMLEAADAVDNTARQLGVSRESLQALQREAELTTGSTEKITSALLRVARAQAQAAGGESTPVRAFEQLGISIEEINRLDPAELFEKISKSVTNAGARSEQASGASLILGRSYAELTTVMETLANDGLAGLTESMLASNQIMTEDSIKAADTIEETWNRSIKSITVRLQGFYITQIQRAGQAVGFISALAGGAGVKDALAISKGATNEALGITEESDKKSKMQSLPTTGTSTRNISRVSIPKASDQVSKIGGIIGSQRISNQERLAAEQLALQRVANEKLDRIADASKKTSDNTDALTED